MMQFVHSRLSLPARLLLLGALALAPVLLMVALLVGQGWKDIAFARREAVGTVYLQAIWPVALDAAQGRTDARTIAALERAAQRIDPVLKTQARAVLEAKAPSARLGEAVSLIGKVADASNLTLDPDLDSFYVMDAVTVKLPALLVAAVDRAGDAGEAAVRSERVRAASEGALADLASGMEYNAAGTTRRAIESRVPPLKIETTALRAALRAGELGPPARLLQATDQAWRAAGDELLRLLEARESSLQVHLVLNLALALLFTALAAAVGFLIARALGARIADLVTVMERVAAGDVSVKTPHLSDRNETGRIAAGVEAFRNALEVQERLKAAATEERQRNDRLRAESDAARLREAETQSEVVTILAEELSRVAAGDLTRRILRAFPEAYEALRADFNTAVADLDEAVSTMAECICGLENSTREISSASNDLSRRTEHQAATLEQTAAVIEELSATVARTSQGAQKAADVATRSRQQAEGSTRVVQEAMDVMAVIRQSSANIGQIVGLIDEIAFQTNLLALNAGVEAARAGDAGKGFAVVAQEVRALSQRSAEAAREISKLVRAATAEVGRGVEKVSATSEVIAAIAGDIGGVNLLVQEFSASAQEQSIGLRQVNLAVNQMDQVTQQNAAMVEQTNAATHALLNDMRALSTLAGRFRVTAFRIPNAA